MPARGHVVQPRDDIVVVLETVTPPRPGHDQQGGAQPVRFDPLEPFT
jgi:hypothetical protein